jgi:tetratricopeptide (TPR) repeat protein
MFLLAGLIALYLSWPEEAQELPAISAPGLDPEVTAAIETARQQVIANPHSGDAWGELGLVLYAHELFPEAVQCFARAQKLDRRNRRWPYFQGIILTESDPERALICLRRAAELSPSDHVPQLRLAEALLLRDLLDESERAYQQTLALSPGHPRAWLGLGRIAYQHGQLQESLNRLGRAVDSPVSRRAAWAAIAEVHRRLGNETAAAAAEQRTHELPADQTWPDHLGREARAKAAGIVRRRSLAWQAWKEGDTKTSLSLLEENVRKDPNDAASFALAGLILFEKHERQAAEKALREAIRLNPQDGQSHMLLGIILADRKNLDAAIESFERALRIEATSIELVNQLAQCYSLKGDRSRAIETLQTGLRYRPDAAILHTELGNFLLQEGKPGEALTALERAALLSPADDRTRKLLEEARRQAPKPAGAVSPLP